MFSSQPVDFPVRLVGGAHNCSGRVEIFFGGRWGTVCHNHWDWQDARVVARELGCGAVLYAPGGAHFGQGTGDILLDWVQCSGREAKLSHCRRPGIGASISCGHNNYASVVSAGTVNSL